MKDSGIRPMKGILWPTNALQYQWETKRKKTVFSQYTKKKKKGKKSTGLIFISADLGMLSSGISGMVLNLLQ